MADRIDEIVDASLQAIPGCWTRQIFEIRSDGAYYESMTEDADGYVTMESGWGMIVSDFVVEQQFQDVPRDPTVKF